MAERLDPNDIFARLVKRCAMAAEVGEHTIPVGLKTLGVVSALANIGRKVLAGDAAAVEQATKRYNQLIAILEADHG